MKKYIVPILLALTMALTLYNTFFLGKVKETTPQVQIVETEKPRIVETSGYDYSQNMVIGNKLQLTPIIAVSHVGLPLGEGQLWFDAVNEAIRFWGGNYSQGEEIPTGRFLTDVLTFEVGGDTLLEFPTLLNVGRVVEYRLTGDTLDSENVTFHLEEHSDYPSDTVFNLVDSVVFPFTLGTADIDLKFESPSVSHYNRAWVDFDTATVGELQLTRKIWILAK